MKKAICIAGSLMLATSAYAQWAGSSTTTGNIYRTGNVGIGNSSPLLPIDVRGSSTFGGGATISTYLVSPFANERHLFVTGSASGGSNSYGSVILGTNDTPASGQWLGGLVFGQNMTGSGISGGTAAGLKAAIRGLSSGSGGSTGGYGGAMIFCTTGDNSSTIVPERMRIDMDGNVGIGTASTGGRLEVDQAANPSGFATAGQFFSIGASLNNRGIRSEASNGSYNDAGTFVTSGGSTQNLGIVISNNASGQPSNDWGIYCIGRTWCTAGAWTGSDARIKDNIKPLENVLQKIMLLKPSTYRFKTKEYSGMNLPEGPQIGLIAQELEQVFPETVADVKGVTRKNNRGEVDINCPDVKGVNYTALIPVLVKGIQEQQTVIEKLSATVAAQNEMIDAMRKTGAATGFGEVNSAVDGFNLGQNIPNPFTNETSVDYSLPNTVSNASMIIYDLSGKQLTTFPLEKNKRSITITSEKLVAGIYIYSIFADGKILDSKRMVVANKE